MQDSTPVKASEITIDTGGITATAQSTGFVEEGNYTPPVPTPDSTPAIQKSKDVPPPDEGVPNTKEESPDEDLYKFFGKEVEETLGIEIETKPTVPPIEEPINLDNIQRQEVTPPEVKGTVETSAAQSTPTPAYTEDQVNDIVAAKVAEEVKKFEHINTFFEEYQKDPYKYMAKHSPHLFEKFDEIQYVKDKLGSEFGEEFTPDPGRVYQIGTTDYAFRVRQDELLREAQQMKSEAAQNISSQQAAIDQTEQGYKMAKAQALGLDVTSFESKVWNKLKGMDTQSVLDTLVDAIIYKEKLAEKDANIKQQIDLTKGVPSPSNVSGTGKPAEGDRELELLKKMFGDKYD